MPDFDYIYRASNSDGGTYWAEDKETARYYADNSGFGGGYLWRHPYPRRSAIHRLKSPDALYDYVDDPERLGDEWWVFDALERNPEATPRLRSEGHEWLEYPDPLSLHPDAWTLSYIGKKPLTETELVERVSGTYHPRVAKLDHQLRLRAEAKRRGSRRRPGLGRQRRGSL